MKRLITLLLVVGLVLGVWYWASHKENKVAEVAPRAPANHLLLPEGAPQRAFLRIEPLSEAPLPSAGPFNGRLVSADNLTARVFPAVGGRVLKVLVNIGDKVSKGTPLAVLDSPDFGSAVADARKAEADFAMKDQAARRAEALLADEALSRREVEATLADARAARAESERTKARLANLGAVADHTDGRTLVLRSPIDGVIIDRQTNPGTEVRNDAANPLFVVAALGELTLLIDLPEKDAQGVRPGDSATFSTEANASDIFEASLDRIAPAVDPVTRRVTVRAKVDNRSGRLRPEMYVRVALVAKSREKGLRIPISAVLTQGLNATVFVESKPGDFERRTVKLLHQDRDFAYLVSGEGVQLGDKIVVKGAMLLASELAGAE